MAPSAVAVTEPEADAPVPTVRRSKVAWEPAAVVALLDALALAEAANAIGVEARMRPNTVEISSPNLLISSSCTFTLLRKSCGARILLWAAAAIQIEDVPARHREAEEPVQARPV